MAPRTIEEMRLRRAVIVSEGLYTTLKTRYAEAKLAEASAVPDVRILDPAVAPLKPTKNTTPTCARNAAAPRVPLSTYPRTSIAGFSTMTRVTAAPLAACASGLAAAARVRAGVSRPPGTEADPAAGAEGAPESATAWISAAAFCTFVIVEAVPAGPTVSSRTLCMTWGKVSTSALAWYRSDHAPQPAANAIIESLR